MNNSHAVPGFLTRRVWWLLLLLTWAAAVGGSLYLHLADLHRQALDVATEGARDMFRMVVLVRSWNAEHGGLYLPVSEKLQPNPYLDHPRRDLITTDGQALTLVNPAYMTRLLSEKAAANGGTIFHITSLKPIRPANEPDEWERRALEGFERGSKEAVELLTLADGEPQLRYMAPLRVEKPCMKCHEKQGYKVGDIRGGISVSQAFTPMIESTIAGHRQTYALHGAVFLLVAGVGGWLLVVLRRRWSNLVDALGTLGKAQRQLADSNRSLAQALDTAGTASRLKSMFLSAMGHELRTPLNAIVGFTHLLGKSDVEASRQALLDGVATASDRLMEVIDKVLEFSRSESGEISVALADFSLDELLDKLFMLLQRDCGNKGLTCRLERDPGLPEWLYGDARHIDQLVGYFASNAVKFSERGEIVLRAVAVDAGTEGQRIRFEIVDQGIGIDAGQQGKLFQAFWQLDISTTRRAGGVGVGLALCKRLAELMGGEVGVISTLGRGSCFWFEVILPQGSAQERAHVSPGPTAFVPPDPAVATDQTPMLLTRLEALLVQDDVEATFLWRKHADLLRQALRGHGAAVEREISAFHFDIALAILRQAMRKEDGL